MKGVFAAYVSGGCCKYQVASASVIADSWVHSKVWSGIIIDIQVDNMISVMEFTLTGLIGLTAQLYRSDKT